MREKKRIWIFVLLTVAMFSFLGASVARNPSASDEPIKETEAEVKSNICNLLLLGKDNVADLCDVMMLVSLNSTSGQLSVVQIPRDTYFSYTASDYKKINAASHRLGGAEKFKKKLSDALGVPIDGYIEFDLDFVRDAVDMVGGVELDVPCDMHYDDPQQNLSIHLKKGKQMLMGEDAVAFVRFRSGYRRADLGRRDAQKLFLAAFSRAFSEHVGVSEIPRMIWLATKHLKTDVRLDTMISVAVGMRNLPGENITVLTLPGEEVQSEYSGAWYYILSRDGCADAIEKYLTDGVYSGFDPNGLFTDKSRKNFLEIYQRKIFAVPYTFTALMKDGISIE